MGYLFLVNLGPIQSFIASARRTRDLWFGSMLLSELSKTAARVIMVYDGGGRAELIFPVPDATKKEPDDKLEELKAGSNLAVANKIVAYIPSASTDDMRASAKELGRLVKEGVQQHLLALKKSVYEDLVSAAHKYPSGPIRIEELIDVDIADKQVADLVECVWVAVPFEKGQDDYAERRDRLERLLDMRKNTRDFLAASGSERPKSSISGQLESVIQDSFYPRPNTRDTRELREKALKRYVIFRAGPAEYLSGVDLLKRLGKIERDGEVLDSFLSTSHVASIPYLERLERLYEQSNEDKQEQIKKSWGQYINTIREIIPSSEVQRGGRDSYGALMSVLERIPTRYKPYQKSSILARHDGALLFQERLREDFSNPTDFQKVSDALDAFFKSVQSPVVRPYPYYAILSADGDGMGKLIDALAEKGESFEGHQEVSKKLATFAKSVQKIVEEEHKGTLIYAGGDDVLAFVPLHKVLSCARKLADTFQKTLNFEEVEALPTLSVGIAIVHHLSLLRDSLQQARRTEEWAKDLSGKGALAIALYRRSGEEYRVRGKLDELSKYLMWLTPYFMPTAEKEPENALQRIGMPGGAAYELRATALRLTPFSNYIPVQSREAREAEMKERVTLQAALKADMQRILQRKLKASAKSNTKEVQEAINLLLSIFKRRTGTSLDEKDQQHLNAINETFLKELTAVSELEFINEFIIAHELADVCIHAGQTRLEVYAQQQKEFAQ